MALLPVGLAVPPLLPGPRWALTPPFHPYPRGRGRFHFCGAFRRVAPPGRYPAPLLVGVRTFLGGRTRRDHPAFRARGQVVGPGRRGQWGGSTGRPLFAVQAGSGASGSAKSAAQRGPCRHGPARSRVVASKVSKGTSAVKPAERAACRKLAFDTSASVSAASEAASPCRARRPQSKRAPGSNFRPGARSEWPITPAGRMAQRDMISGRRLSSARIKGSEKG